MTTGADDARSVVTTTLDAMASGGMYDHIGGGFARYSVDRQWLVPHFEKMLYDQALLVRVYRQAHTVLRHRPLPPGRRGDDRIRAARPAPSRRRLLLGRGRRLAGRARPRARRAVPHVDAGRGRCRPRRMVRTGCRRGARVVRHLARRQLRGALDPQPARVTAASWPDPASIENARRLLFEAREQRAAPGARRQDPHRVERALPVGAGRRRGGVPTRRLEAGRDRQRRVPAPRAARRTRPVAPLVAGRRHRRTARHQALAADHAALGARVPAPRRADRRGALGRGARSDDGGHDARLVLGSEQGGLYTTAEDAEGLVVRQKDLFDNATPSRQLDGRRRLACDWPR